MPAQPGDDAGALSDEVFTMVDQQPELALDPVETRDWQVRFRNAARATARASIGSDLP